MDVVYPYKRALDEFELRYSLRSLVNVPHDRVIVAGDKPRFVNEAVFWAGTMPVADRFKSSTTNIVEAARQAEITGEFIVMNDDMFVLEPWEFRHEDRGSIDEYLGTGAPAGGYRRRLQRTGEILRAHGVNEPLFFGLHTPTVYDSAVLVALVKEFRGESYLLRTLYHNLHPAPSARRDDVKMRHWAGKPAAADMFSVSDACALDLRFRAWMAHRFPDPSVYEKAFSMKEAA